MKKDMFKYLAICLCLFIGLNTSLKAQEKVFSREIGKSFEVKNDASVSIDNRFGKIECISWDKQQIELKIVISVEGAKEKLAQRIFDDIYIDLDTGSDGLDATTEIGSHNLGKGSKMDINIDYYLKAPPGLSYELECKFGDIILDEVSGPAEIEVAYGSLQAKAFSNPMTEIEIAFGNANIDFMEDAEFEIKYSECNVRKANALELNSSFSSLILGKVREIEIESRYDDIEIEAISALHIDSEFSSFKVGKIYEQLELDASYGEFISNWISPDFVTINIESSFLSPELGIDKEASYIVEADMKFGKLKYPQGKSHFSKEVSDYTSKYYYGYVNDEAAKAVVTIESKNGDVVLY